MQGTEGVGLDRFLGLWELISAGMKYMYPAAGLVKMRLMHHHQEHHQGRRAHKVNPRRDAPSLSIVHVVGMHTRVLASPMSALQARTRPRATRWSRRMTGRSPSGATRALRRRRCSRRYQDRFLAYKLATCLQELQSSWDSKGTVNVG